MSSGFVSGGTVDQPVQRDDDWLKAQQDVEATRRLKEEEGRQDGGKSLFEVLQQNKAAKQEAFEESIRLKNQFRSLDDDEVEFLDSVLESTRAKEAEVKRETFEQLEAFRKQQEAAERALLDEASDPSAINAGAAAPIEQETWTTTGKKRRRAKDKDILVGAKLRKTSSSAENNGLDRHDIVEDAKEPDEPQKSSEAAAGASNILSKWMSQSQPPAQKQLEGAATSETATGPSALGLGAYSSDEE